MRKKSMKRVMAVLLGCMLIFNIFGCSKKDDSTKTNNSEKQTQEEATATEPAAVTKLSEDEVFKPYDETVTLTAARIGIASNNLPEGEKFETNQYIQWVEKKLNIKLNYTFLGTDAESYKTRINLMITTGDIPDIAMVDHTMYLLNMNKARQIR